MQLQEPETGGKAAGAYVKPYFQTHADVLSPAAQEEPPSLKPTRLKTTDTENEGSNSGRRGRWIMLPREHGAWSMVSLPLLAGIALSRGDWLSLNTFAAVLAVFSVFLFREPLVFLKRIRRDSARPEARIQEAVAHRTLILCLAGMTLSGIILLKTLPPLSILLLGGGALALVIGSAEIAFQRKQREITAQILGVVGLTSSCLPAYMAVHGSIDQMAFAIWVLSATHSIAAVLIVRARLEAMMAQRRSGTGTTSRRFYQTAVAWQAGLWSVLLLMAMVGFPWLVIMFLIPSALHWRDLWRFHSGCGLDLSLHRTGWRQVGGSLAFYSLVILLMLGRSLQ